MVVLLLERTSDRVLFYRALPDHWAQRTPHCRGIAPSGAASRNWKKRPCVLPPPWPAWAGVSAAAWSGRRAAHTTETGLLERAEDRFSYPITITHFARFTALSHR